MNIFGVWLTISYKDFGFHFLLIKNKQYEIECSYAMNDSDSRFGFRIFWNKSCMHSKNNCYNFRLNFSTLKFVPFDSTWNSKFELPTKPFQPLVLLIFCSIFIYVVCGVIMNNYEKTKKNDYKFFKYYLVWMSIIITF